MTHAITESQTEQAALDILKKMGYTILYGPDIAPEPEGIRPERSSYSDIILISRLREAIARINPDIPSEAREEALKKALRIESPLLEVNNERFHSMIVNGVDVGFKRGDRVIYDKVWLIDFSNIRNNEFLAVNQFTIIENDHNRRPDIVLFINGLPIGIIELKNPADENATIWSAFNQFQTYKNDIPTIFNYNELLIISDGLDARSGTITSNKDRFMAWKTIRGKREVRGTHPGLDAMLRGMLEKEVLLNLIRHFIVFEKEKTGTFKKMAAYHQYYAVNRAVEETSRASRPREDKRCGVVWHTQGSGKSLSMVFYAGKMILNIDNPTIVVLTDRNDLDDQLFGTFSRCSSLLRQSPVQANSREELKELLKVASGGVVFTTIQKFFPEEKGEKYPMLSDRHNIIVIADEAHRSQYDFIDGFARHMRDALPNAAFIGFTGTPIERSDRNTIAVFGDHIDVYDIEQAVKDKATVPIYYESRLVKLELKGDETLIDSEFEDVTEGEEVAKKEKLKTKWARLEAIVGSEKRIKKIAEDIVDHFEKRLEVMKGKAIIVCMSRRICVELYKEITTRRPEWHNDEDSRGAIKVVMTGSATDPVDWQGHIRNKERRRNIGDRFKDANDPLKIAIVRDMWLTGFDVPCLHTMYVDKPMRGHGLMQAIARVNRVYGDKPGGLIVDYLGIAHDLKKALAEYTKSGGKGKPTFEQEDAVAFMIEQYEIVCGLFKGFDYKKAFGLKHFEYLTVVKEAAEHVLKQKDGKERCFNFVSKLSKGFALSVPHPEALKIQDDVGFFQAVRAAIAKLDITAAAAKADEVDAAVRQIVSKAISSDEIMDIFKIAGLEKPDISILSEEFLEEVRSIPQKNLAVEVLQKLLNDEIKSRMRKNLVKSRSFAKLLDEAIKKYHNKAIEAAEIIEELIRLGKKIREDEARGKDLGLNEEELAFYDALCDNDSAQKILGDKKLSIIAHELVDTVRKNVTIDWTLRENIQAKIRVMVKRILKKYGYPPDKTKQATELVLEQAAVICKDWAEKI